jgi:hypothetical protein
VESGRAEPDSYFLKPCAGTIGQGFKGAIAMPPRSALLVLALLAVSLAATTEAQARRGGLGRIFSGSSAKAPPSRPQNAVKPATPAPAAAAAPGRRSGSFVFIGTGGRGAPALAGTEGQERERPPASPQPIIAAGTSLTPNPSPAVPKVPRPAYGFEIVSSVGGSFEVVTMGK